MNERLTCKPSHSSMEQCPVDVVFYIQTKQHHLQLCICLHLPAPFFDKMFHPLNKFCRTIPLRTIKYLSQMHFDLFE